VMAGAHQHVHQIARRGDHICILRRHTRRQLVSCTCREWVQVGTQRRNLEDVGLRWFLSLPLGIVNGSAPDRQGNCNIILHNMGVHREMVGLMSCKKTHCIVLISDVHTTQAFELTRI